MNAETYRVAFRRLLTLGYQPADAIEEFEIDRLRAALQEELENRGRMALNDENSLFSMCARAWKDQAEIRDLGQACDLWGVGWKSETPHGERQSEVMSWYWRSPSKRPGKPGRRFLSTNQAWNALRRG